MNQPNILFISVDSLRADYCSFLPGATSDTTPFLESIASESTIYTSAISTSTWTLPVHTSVFTGLFPPEHGILTGKETLGDHPTIAEILSEHGYSTRAFYRNGWLDTGNILRGFDVLERDGNSAKESTSDTPRLKQLSETIQSFSPKSEELLRACYKSSIQWRKWSGDNVNNKSESTGGRRTIDRCVDQLSDTHNPFFWFVHLNDAHWQYTPPSPYHQKFTNRSTPSLLYLSLIHI